MASLHKINNANLTLVKSKQGLEEIMIKREKILGGNFRGKCFMNKKLFNIIENLLSYSIA